MFPSEHLQVGHNTKVPYGIKWRKIQIDNVWCTAETCTGVAAETRAHAHLNGHLGSI
jgi:hypothetical protein